MLSQNQIVQNIYGEHYLLYLRGRATLHVPIEPEDFWAGAGNFVSSIRMSHDGWLRILREVRKSPPGHHLSPHDCKQAIAALLKQKSITVYRLPHLRQGQQRNSRLVIEATRDMHYHIVPTSLLLTNKSESDAVKSFRNDPKQAHQFIEMLALTDEQLQTITSTLPSWFPAPTNLTTIPRAEQIATLEQALVKADIVVITKQVRMAPPKRGPEDLPTEPYVHRPMTLGLHEEGMYTPRTNRKNAQSGNKTQPPIDDQAVALNNAQRRGKDFCEIC